MNDVGHAGYVYSSVGQSTVIYTRRSSTEMPHRLSCSRRNSLWQAFRVFVFINVCVPCQVAGDSNSNYRRLDYSLGVCFVDTYGWKCCPCQVEINNKVFVLHLLSFVSFWIVHCYAASTASWEYDPA